jgi:signal peptidase I
MNGRLNTAIWVLVLGGAVAFLLHLYVIEIWTIPVDDPLLAASVAPTLRGGDMLVVMRGNSIERGQLVRCQDPQAAGRFVIARALAHSGEQVDIRGETIAVDRRRNPSPRGCSRVKVFDPNRNEEVDLECMVEEFAGRDYNILLSKAFPEPPMSSTVEFGKWFLASDDRHVHLDSRDYGPIDPTTCQHIALRLIGPAGISDSDSRFTFVW